MHPYLLTRDAVRSMRNAAGINTAIVTTLAIAAGVNLAMLGMVDRLLLSPPRHLEDPSRLARVTFARDGADGRGGAMSTTSFPAFEALRDHVPAFTGAGAFVPRSIIAAIGDEPIQIDAAVVSGGYFDVLGAAPYSGRLLREADDRDEAEPAIVVSYRLWKARLARRNQPVRTVEIDGRPFTIVGVTEPGFTGHANSGIDAWIPLSAGLADSPGWRFNPGRNIVSVVARLAPGASAGVAATQASAAAARPDVHVVLAPLVPGWAGASASADTRIALWLAGISALVFITGIANAGTLLLIAAARRSHAVAVRAALGASRRLLVGQIVLESALLSSAAMAGGVLLSWWIAETVRMVLLPGLAPDDSAIDGRLLAAVASAGLIAAAAMSALVASRLPRSAEPDALRGRAGDVLPRGRRTQSALLVVQTALAMVLVVGAGLFGRSLYNVRAQDFGFEPRSLLLASFDVGPGSVPNQNDVFTRALERVRELPGVAQATVVQATPFAAHNIPPIAVPGLPDPPSINGQLPFLSAATPEFFSVLGMTLIRGRLLTADDERGRPVAVVNESMARGAWPGREAIGQCFRIGFGPDFDPETATGPPIPPESLPCREVVGVVKDMRQRSVLPDGGEDRLMQYFVPFSQMPSPPMGEGGGAQISALLVRVRPGAAGIEPSIRDALASALDPAAPAGGGAPARVQRYEDLFDRQMRPWRLGATLLMLFGAIALLMSGVGIYAAFAHVVASRGRELAIRAALGAERRHLAQMVLTHVLQVAAVGVFLGTLLALAGGQYIASQLFQTVPYDPAVLAAAAVLVAVLAVLGGALPARTAARTNPQEMLRM